ncbi:MAG: DMT family transporter [Clostridia bacterium]|nr:DMT family transporter [Clostridia bacterium]
MKYNLCAIVAAFIWGTAFVAQSVGADLLPTFAFNTVRSLIATVALLILLAVLSKIRKQSFLPPKQNRKPLLIGGLLCGTALAIASGLQQHALATAPPGKAGFLTALYLVLVPIAGLLLFRRKVSLSVWLAVGLATVGLYLLCMTDSSFTIELSDLLLILCAISFTVHILLIDYFTKRVDAVRLSCLQFFMVAVISALLIPILDEPPDWSLLPQCAVPLLYTGVLSSGVAFTLQIVAQKGSNPTVITVLMSLESLFAVLADAALGGSLTPREYVGCAVMLAAVILAQLPPLDKLRKKV